MAKIYDFDIYRRFRILVSWNRAYYTCDELLDRALYRAYEEESEDL